MNPILELKQQIAKNGTPGIAVDIDETLSWTIGYWVEQMQTKFGNPEHLSVQELITKYRYTQNVPYWQTPEALAWMEEQRASNELQTALPLIENADTTLQQIHEIIPVVAYITIRPESVKSGTQQWLNTHGFPQAPILCRPNDIPSAEGNTWKATVLQQLYPEVIGIIDDNPALVTTLLPDYPGKIYLYDHTDHIQKSERVIPCATWNDVLLQFQKR